MHYQNADSYSSDDKHPEEPEIMNESLHKKGRAGFIRKVYGI